LATTSTSSPEVRCRVADLFISICCYLAGSVLVASSVFIFYLFCWYFFFHFPPNQASAIAVAERLPPFPGFPIFRPASLIKE